MTVGEITIKIKLKFLFCIHIKITAYLKLLIKSGHVYAMFTWFGTAALPCLCLIKFKTAAYHFEHAKNTKFDSV